jgi:hypothetical protein
MNSKRLVITSLLLFGSLWGLAELGIDQLALPEGLPRAPLLTGAAIFFLILSRRIWDAPGSSFALGVLASAFKFLNHPFFGCKIAAVLMLGAIFDLAFSLFHEDGRSHEQRPLRGAHGTYARAAAATFVSFVGFGFFARYVLANPFWVAGGAARMIEYQLLHGAIATALAIPVTFAAVRAAEPVIRASATWNNAEWAAYRLAAIGSGLAGVAAALATQH